MNLPGIDLQKMTPQQFRNIKIEDILHLPYKAENGINFFKDRQLPNHYMYSKNSCRGVIKLNNCVYGHGVYGLMIDTIAYWTQIFGDSKGSASIRIQNDDTTKTALDKLAVEIEKAYKAYHKF